MLRFQIPSKEFGGDTERIEFSDIELENYGYTDGNSISVLFTCDEPHNLKVGDYLKIVSTVPYWNDRMNEMQEEGDVAYLRVATADNFTNSFSVIASKYKTLDCQNAYTQEEDGRTYWYFDFTPTHHYRVGDTAILYLVYNNTDYLYISNGEVVDCETIKWQYDPMAPNAVACQRILFPDWGVEQTQTTDGVPQKIQFTRPQVKWDYYLSTTDGLDVYVNRYKVSINIPLQVDSDVRLYSEENIREYFIENETQNAINKPTEMEKRVYTPVILTAGNEFKDILQINFNLHMRVHSGDEWTVENSDDWNFSKYGVHNADKYYSYNNRDNQPDLLSYLNFTTRDIKYQKNTLKKTFLRLMFYDSMNPGSQNLLCYSTVFFDTGKLYSKVMSNSLLEAYYYDDGTDASGIGAEREVNEARLESLLGVDTLTDTMIEDHRLGAQFAIYNKFASQNSSEGFYLYLWADNDNGIIPETIYMKVDLNHAGCGRTIPFMAPYWSNEIDNRRGFKTNTDIIDDWRNGGYGIQQYLRYSYIKFKYVYDKERNRHVYYPDPDRYGSLTDNVLNINLYEARVAF